MKLPDAIRRIDPRFVQAAVILSIFLSALSLIFLRSYVWSWPTADEIALQNSLPRRLVLSPAFFCGCLFLVAIAVWWAVNYTRRTYEIFLHSIVVIFVALSLIVLGFEQVLAPRKLVGDAFEQWETSRGRFKLRVTAYHEFSQWEPGGYYVFESASRGSSQWRKVMNFRHDDAVPIPRGHIQFVNDQTGYVFMGWKYAVTIDGGLTWGISEPTCCHSGCRSNYELIKDVQISATGTGQMALNPIALPPGASSLLYTRDYGLHWSCAPGS
jgi:hypothetical protein